MVLVEVSFDLTASPRNIWADTTSGFLIGSVEWRNLFLGSASLSVPAFRQHSLHQGSSHWRHPSALLFLGMPERVAGLAVLKPWKQAQLYFLPCVIRTGVRVMVLLPGSVAVEREDLGCCPRKTFPVAL